MTESEILKDSAVLDGEFERICSRYDKASVLDALKTEYPEAASEFVKRQAIKQAEAKALSAQQAKANDENSIRNEIAEALRAIKEAELQKSELAGLSDAEVQAELTQRAAIATRQAAERGE